jgi:ABC-type polysaccharide/polyol phosphate export permease
MPSSQPSIADSVSNLTAMQAATPATASARADDEFNPETHVYEPHRVGLPPLRPYVRALWRRRQFAFELARTSLRAQHYNTAFGQLWLVLNPLLLTCVYFLLVDILRGGTRGTEFFAHLMAGLFAFHFLSQSLTQSARSVTRGGRLVLNTAFPRTLLPLSSVLTGFMRFLPTMGVYAVMHVIAGLPIGLHLLWVIPVFAVLAVFTMGVCTLVAAAQVYFRDVSNFLPYFNRIWMYGSPVLYYYDEVPERLRWIIDLNPVTPMLAMWSEVLNRGHAPSLDLMLWGIAWAVAAFVAGTLFFISREREFAVRL